MKVKITVPKIKAKKITWPPSNDDEIYLAYYISLAKQEEDVEARKYVIKKLSNYQPHVSTGDSWKPRYLDSTIDTGNAKVMYITLALYEFDDGEIFKKLHDGLDVLIEPEDYDWTIINIPENLTSPMAWLKVVWKVVSYTWNYFREDDHLGTKTLMFKKLTTKKLNGKHIVKFKEFGADYEVTVNLEVNKEK